MCMINPIFDLSDFKPEKLYKLIKFYKNGDLVQNIFDIRKSANEDGWFTPYAGYPITEKIISKYEPELIVDQIGSNEFVYSIGKNCIHGYYDILQAEDALNWLVSGRETIAKIVEVTSDSIIAYNKQGEFICRSMEFNPKDLEVPNETIKTRTPIQSW